MNRHGLLCLVVAASIGALLPTSLWAQARESGVSVYEEQLRVAMDRQQVRADGFDGGGWFSIAWMHYDDQPAHQWRDLRRYELRGWASLALDHGTHQFYVRGLLQYDDWDGGANPTNNRGDDFTERIERAWYRLDIAKLLTGDVEPSFGATMSVGREYRTIGSALVLSMPLDSIQWDVAVGDWTFTALLGKTVRSTYNMDPSEPVAHHQDRCFYGFQVGYRGLQNHRPYAYFLSQFDHTTPKPRSATQRYDYSSRYLGIGSTGFLGSAQLTYTAELVGEWGRTFSEGATNGQDEICAWAGDLQLEYLFRSPMNPRLMFEYLAATGDSDRRVGTNSTLGGNLLGTRDKAFNAFGFRDTGIALAPEISNLHMWMVGGRANPLVDVKGFEDFELGTKVFFYAKAESDGPISDFAAGSDSHWLGWEWDVYCNWRITSDLAWTARYGAFFPGSAYDGGDKTCRQFLYTGVSLSF